MGMVANDLCIKAKARCGSVKSRASVVWCVQGFTAFRERSGSVVECLIRDRGAAVSSLKGVTALCPCARHIILA